MVEGIGVWSWGEVTLVELKISGVVVHVVADGFRRRLPAEGLEVFGKVAG